MRVKNPPHHGLSVKDDCLEPRTGTLKLDDHGRAVEEIDEDNCPACVELLCEAIFGGKTYGSDRHPSTGISPLRHGRRNRSVIGG